MQFKEKLLLVIDGLDEITADRILETGHTIFDYIPAPQQLAENVYILLTCRTGEEEPLSQFVSQRIEHLSLTESYTVDRKLCRLEAVCQSDGDGDQRQRFVGNGQ